VIEITRALARHFRAVLRKSASSASARATRVVLVLQCGKDGLYLRGQYEDVALQYHLPGSRPPEILSLPVAALQDFEGSKDSTVTLEKVADTVNARWDDAGVPQVKEYPFTDPAKFPPFPEVPSKRTPLPEAFLKALDDAARTVAVESARYATTRLQLRGARGEVVGTDGRQLLLQGGFSLPWKEDVLVPALDVFNCKELHTEGTVAIGRTDTHVCITMGPWTFFLLIDPVGRYPSVDNVIPRTTNNATTCTWSPEDAVFLIRALPRLPGQGEEHNPVTVDLDSKVAVRARGEGQGRVAEVVLSRSQVSGPPVRFVTDRTFLVRAAQLGFMEFRVLSPDKPIVCRDGRKIYLWVPLGADSAIPPSEDVLRITSDQEVVSPAAPPGERKKVEVTTPRISAQRSRGRGLPAARVNGTASGPQGTGLGALIEEAQSLKVALRETYTRLSRLVAGLKRHRRQSRLVSATLASLKALRQMED
jgi:hypothetical protein